MELTYFGALATNGFDDISHYLRANLLINVCTLYQTTSDTLVHRELPEPGAGQLGSRRG